MECSWAHPLSRLECLVVGKEAGNFQPCLPSFFRFFFIYFSSSVHNILSVDELLAKLEMLAISCRQSDNDDSGGMCVYDEDEDNVHKSMVHVCSSLRIPL